MESSQKFIRGTIFQLLARVFFLFATMSIHFFSARYLGKNLYGILTLLLTIALIFRLFIVGGTYQTVSHFIAYYPDKIGEIYKTTIFMQIILTIFVSLAFVLLSPFIANFLKEEAIKKYGLYILLTIFSMSFYSYFTAIINGLKKLREQSLISMIYDFLRMSFIIAGLYCFKDLSFFFLGLFAATFIAGLIAMNLVFKNVFIKRSGFFPIKPLLFFSLPLIILTLLNTFLLNVDVLVIKRILVKNEFVGLYSAIANIAKVPYHIYLGFAFAILPTFSSFYSDNKKEKVNFYLAKIIKIIFIFSSFMTIICFYKGREIIRLIYGPKYEEGGIFLSGLIFSYSLLSIIILFNTTYISKKKNFFPVLLNTLILSLLILSDAIFVKFFGLKGAVYGAIITFLPFVIFLSASFFKKIFYKSQFKFAILILLTFFISYILKNMPFLAYTLLITFFYFFLALLLKIISPSELCFLIKK